MLRTFLFLLFPGGLFSQIEFLQIDLAAAQQKAAAEGKLIFIDAYTTWCGPCRAMAKNIFTSRSVSDFYNNGFINLKIDMEKGEGPALSVQYSVNCYPSFLFLDSAGTVVHRSAGYMDSLAFVGTGQLALSPDRSYSALEKRFRSDISDTTIALQFLQAALGSCLSADKEADMFFRELPDAVRMGSTGWIVLRDYIEDYKTGSFKFLVENRKRYGALYSAREVDDKIYNTYLRCAQSVIYADKKIDELALREVKTSAGKSGIARSEELLLEIDLAYYSAGRNWDAYFMTAKPLLNKFRTEDVSLLNNISYTLYEHSYRPEQLKQALQWAKRSVELEEHPYNLDTYACLLSRNGRREEAVVMQKKAIETGKAAGEDVTQLEENLKKLESGK